MAARASGLLRRKWRAWRRYSSAGRWLIVEAAVWLGLARFYIRWFPFRWLRPWLRRSERADHDPQLATRIGRAVLTAARHVPWQAACLPQALAAKLMLGLRGLGSTVHLGARFDEVGDLAAHAWLTCGDKVVTGSEDLPGYTPLIRFG